MAEIYKINPQKTILFFLFLLALSLNYAIEGSWKFI